MSVGVGAGHVRTHSPKAAQSKSPSHLKGCQLSRPSLRAQPPPPSSTPSCPASRVGHLLSLAVSPFTPTLKPITRALVEKDGANRNDRCGSCRCRAPGGGAGGGVRARGLVAIWSEERAEAAAAAFAVARLLGESGTSRPLSPYPGP